MFPLVAIDAVGREKMFHPFHIMRPFFVPLCEFSYVPKESYPILVAKM